jgi:uncharacterized coiled-coil DUF342 family protein
MDYDVRSQAQPTPTLGPNEYAEIAKTGVITSEQVHQRVLALVAERDQLRAQVRELSDRVAAINRNLSEVM